MYVHVIILYSILLLFTIQEGMLEIFKKTIFIYIFRFAGTVIATTIIARPGLSFLSNIN